SHIDLVNLQHEFGIFGGQWGSHIFSFLDELQKPLITTLHTVLPDFDPKAQTVLRKIIDHSASIVVITHAASNLLKRYHVDHEKVRVIPHGCPDVPYVPITKAKSDLGLTGRTVLLTFGLLGPGKGIEYAIKALPYLVKKERSLLYLVVGKTHPKLRETEGERYRMKLLRLVEELKLGSHVRFVDSFLSKEELIRYLHATDIVVLPYINQNQVSSGTLTWALGEGKAIVSTPFSHAIEALAEGRGLLAEFRDAASITRCLNILLKDERLRKKIEKKAYQYSRNLVWPKVVEGYINLFKEQIAHEEFDRVQVVPAQLRSTESIN
ncbi:MAG: glycosyltransferase family 4 protein, partial [Candidatus Ranarchaeia archaeon]